ncbi:MAG: TolC family protein [Kofleriaceae bacterium]|nr:TolC family protein [Kofleriaceae bacterium]
MKVLEVAVAAWFVAAPGTARAEGPLTLDRAIELAMSRNERASIADLDVSIAEANLALARTRFLPLVDSQGTVAFRPRNDPGTVAEASIALSQPIFDPSAFPLHSQAKHELAAGKAQRIDDRRRLAFDAASAFFTVLLADQVAQAAQRKLDTAKTNLDTTDAQFKAQLVSSNDVTRAQINLSTAARELAASQGNLQAAYIDLELLLNTRIDAGLAPPAGLLAAGRAPFVVTDDVIANGTSQRLDLVADKELARAAHESAREPKMRYLPSVQLGAEVAATTNAPLSGNTLDALVAISARWTLFDSGARSADAKARDARARILDLEASQLQRSIEAEIRAAALLLASRQQALTAAGTARDAARKGADEALILYRQGLAKAIELVDANDQRFNAEVNYASSEFDVARAYLSLRLAMGLDPLEGK